MPEAQKWPAKERCDHIFEKAKENQEYNRQNEYKGITNVITSNGKKRRVRR